VSLTADLVRERQEFASLGLVVFHRIIFARELGLIDFPFALYQDGEALPVRIDSRGMPSFMAAPNGPEMRPWHSAKAASIISTSRLASAQSPWSGLQDTADSHL